MNRKLKCFLNFIKKIYENCKYNFNNFIYIKKIYNRFNLFNIKFLN